MKERSVVAPPAYQTDLFILCNISRQKRVASQGTGRKCSHSPPTVSVNERDRDLFPKCKEGNSLFCFGKLVAGVMMLDRTFLARIFRKWRHFPESSTNMKNALQRWKPNLAAHPADSMPRMIRSITST